ncbi:MAG: histidinol dehydrogenase [Bryobacterales bacterium]
MLKILSSKNKTAFDRLIARRAQRLSAAEAVVRPILEAVRKRGDRALLQYAKKFDGLEAKSVRVPNADLLRASQGLNKDFRSAIETASKQIRRFAELQMPRPWVRNAGSGVTLGQIVRPLGSVAAYIPGGRYPLPSTLMMTVIPAQVAGVLQISVASPKPAPEILGTAGRLGIENFFQMGGAQAIAAFAFGTETVPRADRIVGPGNVYVTAAKKLLAGEAGIDFIAGPTETVLISADGHPRLLAADMLAQAEHDVDASAILLTTSRKLAAAVAAEVELQLKELPTRAVASKAISGNSAIVVTRSLNEAVDISNRLAPEHLTIHNKTLLPRVQNAGTVFIGAWSAEAAGDYAAGPNHVLPTSGGAALRGGLSVLDYVKIISVQQLEAEGLRRLAPAIVTLARAEGLEAHARSIEVRTNG